MTAQKEQTTYNKNINLQFENVYSFLNKPKREYPNTPKMKMFIIA